MKYNLSKIMSKSNLLHNNYGLTKSVSLSKAWKMAKLEILENELFMLNMKDINGGRTNAVAQMMIAENNKKISEISGKIAELKSEIYPTVKVTETLKKVDAEKVNRSKAMLEKFTAMLSAATSFADKEYCKIQIAKLTREIENSVETTYTREVLDLNAYNAA